MKKELSPGAAARKKKQRDKIFDNSYDTTEFSSAPISFSRDAITVDESIDSTVSHSIVEDLMSAAVGRCDWAVEIMGRPDADKSVTKRELNSVFKFIFESIKGHSVEVFSWMEREMDLDAGKLYDALSNSIKAELHAELKRRGYLKGDKWLLP